MKTPLACLWFELNFSLLFLEKKGRWNISKVQGESPAEIKARSGRRKFKSVRARLGVEIDGYKARAIVKPSLEF